MLILVHPIINSNIDKAYITYRHLYHIEHKTLYYNITEAHVCGIYVIKSSIILQRQRTLIHPIYAES